MLHAELMYNEPALDTESNSTQVNHDSKKYGSLFTLAVPKVKQCSHIRTISFKNLP